MELRSNPQPGNGPERNVAPPRDVQRGQVEARERLHRAKENQANELVAARARIDAAKAQVVARARRMSGGESDRVDLSAAAQVFLEDDELEAARAELVQELKAAYRDGTLNDPARIERAAQQLLGGLSGDE